MVITKGAGRVSEVSAHLDAMPANKRYFDDLNAGVLTNDEAKERREEITKQIYGP